ncbi:hypothetical protein [Myxococcus sp. CA018]|uniref:hypothetical protein n=1 Tax=Myxococcus sp. CA018 TaxID=2651864 RepID=UPI001F08FDC0|nr:hypothetical protein [Myxococcus sp. CA018]
MASRVAIPTRPSAAPAIREPSSLPMRFTAPQFAEHGHPAAGRDRMRLAPGRP